MSGATGGERGPDPEYATLRDFLHQLIEQDPFSRYGAHGIGIGQKVVGGRPQKRLALRVHVVCKLPMSELPPERRIPETFRFAPPGADREVEVPTDVIESPPGRAHSTDLSGKVRPVPGGVKCKSMTYFGSGTLGGWVWDRVDGTIVLLSNQHVLGNTVGGEIQQPGPTGGVSDPDDRIGQVKRSVPIVPYSGRPTWRDCNLVDAAIGEADSSALFDLTVVDIGPAVYDIAAPAVGMQVEKTGQKTGHTAGVVTDVAFNTIIGGYPEGDAVMCDCIRVAPVDASKLWGTQGDSGALVFQAPQQSGLREAVGLHFGGGGTPPNNWGVACTMTNVFAALDLGPLCDGGFAAFLDALFAGPKGADAAPAVAARGQDLSPVAVTLRERRRSPAFHTGLARDVQHRLAASGRGRLLTDAVRRHRAELLSLLVSDGDVRRATAASLRPMLRGAATTSDVLNRRLTEDDVAQLEALAAEVNRRASAELRAAVERLRTLGAGAAGRSLAEVFEVGT